MTVTSFAVRRLCSRERLVAAGVLFAAVALVAIAPAEAVDVLGKRATAPVAAVTAQQAAAAQAAQNAAKQAIDSLGRATRAVTAARDAQRLARENALKGVSNIPNGLTPPPDPLHPENPAGLAPTGGLNDPHVHDSTTTFATPDSWIGIGGLAQTTNGDGSAQVDILQTQQKAILTWDSFNLGRETTLNFGQADSTWIALNRVLDPTAAPSKILGTIKAPGSVYVINRNGIIFGGSAQINVHSLIASDLDIGDISLGNDIGKRNQFFFDSGIGSVADPIRAFSTYSDTDDHPLFPGHTEATNYIGGGVTVEAGAAITTSLLAPDEPGFVYLFGANVTNAGTITSPAGEVALIAGARAVTLTPGVYEGVAFPTEVLPAGVSFRQTGFTLDQYKFYDYLYGFDPSHPNDPPRAVACCNRTGSYVAGVGDATNSGLIETPRGVTAMNGVTVNVTREGVISADTSITRNSMVLLEAAGAINLDGIISVQPYHSDETLPLLSGAATNNSGSTVQTFMPAFVDLKAPGTVRLGSSSLISAPSASVSIQSSDWTTAPSPYWQRLSDNTDLRWNVPASVRGLSQVLVEAGAVIDVAGLQNVQLPADYNFISFQPRGPEFADYPLQRSLSGETFWIDIRETGTRDDGTTWVGTPLGDTSGYVGKVGQSIEQLMTRGGTVALSAATDVLSTGSHVILEQGSIVNVAGGSVIFQPGQVHVTWLIGTDGRIYSMAQADPSKTYAGVAGQYNVQHGPKWGGVTQTFTSGLVPTTRFEEGYVEGHDAGGIKISDVTPRIDGTLYFGSIAGARQIAAGIAPTGSGEVPTQANGTQLPSQGYLNIASLSSVVIGGVQHAAAGSVNFQPQGPLLNLSADGLSSYGLSGLSIKGLDLLVEAGSTLALAPGGNFTAKVGGPIDIAGTVVARGGAVSLTTDPDGTRAQGINPTPSRTASGDADIFVGGVIDVAGRWVNDLGRMGAEQMGPGYINGGSITLTTNKESTEAQGRDTTGSILLAAGSLLDVSSGGYISSSGAAKLAQTGVMAGRGGSISLSLYQGGRDWGPPTGDGSGPYVPATGTPAEIRLGGELRAFGFQSNGSLTLVAPQTIKLGGDPLPAGTGLYLSQAFFDAGGFGSYRFQSEPNAYYNVSDPANITVAAGATLTLKQQNLSSIVDYRGVATGTKIAAIAPRATLPDDLRAPVDLALASPKISLETGSTIAADPKAKIALGGIARGGVLERAQSVLLRGNIVSHSGSVTIQAEQTWFGPQANIDLSGTFVADSRFGVPGGPSVSGKLYGGGNLAINPYDAAIGTTSTVGYVVSEAGAVVDVSGAATTLLAEDPAARGTMSFPIVEVPSWSDAGTVQINTGTFLWGGSFAANGGDPRANNGTLILGGGNAGVSMVQDSATVSAALGGVSSPTSPDALASLATSFGALNGRVTAAVDKLAGFDNIYLYSGSTIYGPQRIFTDLPIDPAVLAGTNGTPAAAAALGQITISGDLNWKTANRLYLGAASIVSTGGAATIEAPYVQLTGGGAAATSGSGTLTVTAQAIDVESASFQGFGSVALNSTGDLRLSTDKVGPVRQNQTTVDLARFAGRLAAGGALSLDAQRIYPISAVDFTIEAGGMLNISAPEESRTDAPLSAGASLKLSAPDIHQNGHLFAPQGQITLGTSATQTVTLGSRSLTSVSLDGQIVPYGETLDGLNWFYNSPVAPISSPPAKSVTFNGGDVAVEEGAIIDARGGGDLQAIEFIAGKGGTKDVLKSQPGGPTVYALVPSKNDAIAAFDVHFTDGHGGVAGDSVPLPGTQIYIDGGHGIPAGTYTLYPAHYATLPGAMRVTYYGSNVGRGISSGTALRDGTVLVTGNYTSSTRPDARSSGSAIFAIQPNNVWQQYSEFTVTSANTYFAQRAIHDGITTPPSPMDAGRLAITAQRSIRLDGLALTAPAEGGRGGELDIAGAKIALVSPDQLAAGDVPAGYIGVNATALNDFGVESILVGGLRGDTSTGTQITAIAADVLVDTGGTALTVPELLLVARGDQSVPGSGEVSVASGSIIATSGVVHRGNGRAYSLTSSSGAQDGALLVASNDSSVSVSGPTGTGSLGRITIASGANISTQLLSMQATAQTNAIVIDPNATLSAKQVALNARTIGILGAGASGAGDAFVVSQGLAAELAAAQSLALRAFAGDMTFYGDVNFSPAATMQRLVLDARSIKGTGSNAVVSLEGGTVTLQNSGAAGTAIAGMQGAFTLNAEQINLAGGSQLIAGFSAVNLNASNRVFLSAAGKLTLGAGSDAVDLNVATPLLLVGSKTGGTKATDTVSQFLIATGGNVHITRPTGTYAEPGISDEIGGNFALKAASIDIASTIQAQAGTLSFEATTGDLTLGDGAFIAAGGYKKTMIDYDTYVAGGSVSLQADAGRVVTATGSVIDVSQPAGGLGYGGEVAIKAAGDANVAGAIRGHGGPGLGGSFSLDAGGALTLDPLADLLFAGGVSGQIDIHTRHGNLALSQGHTLKAHDITLTADDATSGNGRVVIGGLIDATGYSGKTLDGNGQAGGQVGLYGANAVVLTETGVIDASTTHADERGGDVMLGVSWDAAWDPVAKTGGVDLAPGSRINVSGGTKGGLSGGTVTVRAPLDGNNDIKVQRIAAQIDGAREVVVEGVVAFSTNGVGGLNGSDLLASDGQHTRWAGVIDPGRASLSGITLTNGGSGYTSQPSVKISNPNGGADLTGTAVMGLRSAGISAFPPAPALANPPAPGTVLSVTFVPPAGGVAAKGTITVDANGRPSNLVITSPGSGYTSGFAGLQFTVDGFTSTTGATYNGTNGALQVVSVTVPSGLIYTSPPTVTFSGGGSGVQQAVGAAVLAPTGDALFATDILASVAQGTWVYKSPTTGAVVANYGFSAAQSRLGTYETSAGGSVATHVRPGIDLINPDTSINGGDITVASNWNLAAGTAYDLKQNSTIPNTTTQYFDVGSSNIHFDYRLGIEPGALTLRAAGNVTMNASISDGFFQFGDYLNSAYNSALANYQSGRGIDPFGTGNSYVLNDPSLATPIAPYNPLSNGKAPDAKALAAADLFPHELRVCIADCGTTNAVISTVTSPGSWSYRVTAGADVASANPNGLRPLSAFDAAGPLSGRGNVILDKHVRYEQPIPVAGTTNPQTRSVDLPTMLRTGKGDIHVAAARDVIMADQIAPGVIYAGGVNTAKLANGGANNALPVTNPTGFFEPQIVYYNSAQTNFPLFGPPNAAAFPEMGGDVEIEAQRDIVGNTKTTDILNFQFYAPWLMSDVRVSAAARGAGVFAGGSFSQTAWWIQYGSFDQGFLSAGGNVVVEAGRDLLDVSASAPTTGRVSGGLTVDDLPVTHLYGGGNLIARAGRDILGGSFDAGSGHGTVVARRSVGAYGTFRNNTNSNGNFPTLTEPKYTVLAVDTGTLSIVAGRDLSIAGVVNPAELHNQQAAAINPANTSNTPPSLVMDTYGPESAVTVTAIRGDLNIGAVQVTAHTDKGNLSYTAGGGRTYPASFSAVALSGDITTRGLVQTYQGPAGLRANGNAAGIVLSPSDTGVFNLVAAGSIDLTAGLDPNLNKLEDRPVYPISAGPSLIDIAYDPYRPNAWYGLHEDDPAYAGATSKTILSHEDDDGKARIYAVTGDILGYGRPRVSNSTDVDRRRPARIEFNRPAAIYAGRDIVDLNLIVQNVDAGDVSSITSGRDIYYTGLNNDGGIQVAGPGTLVVAAGRDLGPFLPVTHDNQFEAYFQEGIASVGNATDHPVGNVFPFITGDGVNIGGGAIPGMYNSALLGDFKLPVKKRNDLLSTTGANLIVMFGVGKGLDYAAVIDSYVNPANAAEVPHNYLPELASFLTRIGVSSANEEAAWAAFQALSQDLRQVFVDQVFFAELKAVGVDADAAGANGKTANYQRGYQMVNTLFPASLGYTANELSGGTNGANQLVSTGNLNLLHGTIQTQRGGDIFIMGPGGTAVIGSTANEPNSNLKLRDLGIMTLRGGSISTFTDNSVFVNASRVLTVLGGDVVMWSSNGSLDAGRGAKTTLSLPPLAVSFDRDDYQTIDAGGLVTGAGIGSVKSTVFADKSNVYPMAPRGTVDAGDAGLRSSGDIVVLAPVVLNADNISAQGSVTGIVTVQAPSIGAVTAGSNTTGQGSVKTPATPGQEQQPPVIIVEVIGYGGGDSRPDSGYVSPTNELHKDCSAKPETCGR